VYAAQAEFSRGIDAFRVSHAAGTPPGCDSVFDQDRGCRFAQPPANGWHPCRGAGTYCEL